MRLSEGITSVIVAKAQEEAAETKVVAKAAVVAETGTTDAEAEEAKVAAAAVMAAAAAVKDRRIDNLSHRIMTKFADSDYVRQLRSSDAVCKVA